MRIAFLLFFVSAATMALLFYFTRMPGQSFKGPLPPLAAKEAELREELREHVIMLCSTIGERNYIFFKQLEATADYIERLFLKYGFAVERQPYAARDRTFHNIIAEKLGAADPEKIIIIGAHYDSFIGTPGADDNGSGIAALLALARLFSQKILPYTIRFVAFVNEEPPFFWTKDMGSHVYAERCRQRNEQIAAMISLECLGYYADADNTQHYLFPLGLFYPSQGDFIAFVANLSSFNLVRDFTEAFRREAHFPSEGGAFPWFIPGVFWSDHWPFWKMGYPGLMVTDTAFFRNRNYHTEEDRPETLDFERMARVVAGLEKVIPGLAGAD
jgi:hypothetical protein